MRELTERRKADREEMAAQLVALALECGAHAYVDETWPEKRAIMVCVEAARGLGFSLDFDGTSVQPDTHVVSWHIDGRKSDACLADAFLSVGSLNTCHYGKATTIAHGMGELRHYVRAGLELAASGAAFDAKREAASIAKNGTFTERNARFEVWRAEMAAARQPAVAA